MNIRHCRESGLSLVEILIALALSLVLLMGVIEIFASNRQAFRIQTALARIQEAGRFAGERLGYDLRMAGYMGCGNLRTGIFETQVLASPPPVLGMPQYPKNLEAGDVFKVYQAAGSGWTPALPQALTTLPHPPTTGDVVEIHRMGDQIYFLSTDVPKRSSNPIPVTSSAGLESGDLAIISDCRHADIFRITDLGVGGELSHSAGGNIQGALSNSEDYPKDGTFVAKFLSTFYFVGDTGRHSDSGASIPALYRYTPEAGEEEILEGVADLQVQLGLDTDGDGDVDRYQWTSTDVDKALGVRLEFLMRSLNDNVASQPLSYEFAGGVIHPKDHFLRKVFTVQAQLRNLAVGR